MSNQVELSIVVPLFNESSLLTELHERLSKAASLVSSNFEIVFVNDGSKDKTFEQLKLLASQFPEVRFINLSRNFGHQIAVSAGLDNCLGKAVVIIDGDLQDPPEIIPELYKKYQEGHEVVYARRRKREGETVFKKFTARLFYRILNGITNIDIPLDTGDFRLIDRKVVEVLKNMPEKNKFLRGQIAWMGFSQTYVEFDRSERKSGVTGYTFKKMLKLALDGITGFSDVPLRLVTNAGIIVSAISFLVIIYALAKHFVFGETITGWTSLIVSSMFIGGIQLVSIGIIGEYIGRISTDVRDRPLYIIQETNIEKKD